MHYDLTSSDICNSFTPNPQLENIVIFLPKHITFQNNKKKEVIIKQTKNNQIPAKQKIQLSHTPKHHFFPTLLPPFVLASQQQGKVKQNPKEKTPSNSNPQATPLTQISDPLLLQ